MIESGAIISELQVDEIISSSQIISTHIADDPIRLAFKGVSSTLCNQIKFLQKSRTKLPCYYANFCIIPSVSYEQSSSEATAQAKEFGDGLLAVDLTCGLGVDSLYLSRRFEKVITVERDQTLCRVARHNFAKLSAHNIEVHNCDALDFLTNNTALRPDLIYIDPARRNSQKRLFLLEDCSPNMADIMPLAAKMAKKVAVKLSPLFDVDAAYLFFKKWGSCSVETISHRNECKEVVAIITPGESGEEEFMSVRVVDGVGKSRHYSFPKLQELDSSKGDRELSHYTYVYIPDIAFYKSRTIANLMSITYNLQDYFAPSQNSPIFTDSQTSDFEGTSYKIVKSMAYKPKELRKELKKDGNRAKILIKDSKFSVQQIKKELNLKDAPAPILLFTSDYVFELTSL
ncbi:MAG: RsmD family RNA methyltransferase [Rikenellaceae bacterium]